MGPARSCLTRWSRSGRPTGWAATIIPRTRGEDLSVDQDFSGFGRSGTDAGGEFSFSTVKPGPVPGPDGRLQAPHVMVSVFARGLLKRLVTRIYFPDEEEANAVDPVLSSIEDKKLRRTLIARDEGGALRFDIHLQGENQTAFFEL
jgi:protocatechuate 3,4-dioxygenase alpha subunit